MNPYGTSAPEEPRATEEWPWASVALVLICLGTIAGSTCAIREAVDDIRDAVVAPDTADAARRIEQENRDG